MSRLKALHTPRHLTIQCFFMYKDLTMEIVIDDIKGNQMKLFHQDA